MAVKLTGSRNRSPKQLVTVESRGPQNVSAFRVHRHRVNGKKGRVRAGQNHSPGINTVWSIGFLDLFRV